MYYYKFISEWIKRAEQKRPIDDADRFICLWIAFNGWLKKEYGEHTSDSILIAKVATNKNLNLIFQYLNKHSKRFRNNLEKIRSYTILDMRYPRNKNKCKRYDGSFGSLMQVIYQIRCNLFHGRKRFEEDKIDKELITLALRLLRPLFKELIRQFPGSIY